MKKLLAVLLFMLGMAVGASAQTTVTTTNLTGYYYTPYSATAVADDGTTVVIDRISAGRTYAQVKLPGETAFASTQIADPVVSMNTVNGITFYHVVIVDFTLTTSSGRTFTLVTMNWTSERRSRSGRGGGNFYPMDGGVMIGTID